MSLDHIQILTPGREVSMADEWFEMAQPDHFWMDWRFQSLARIPDNLPPSGAKILDIGCGNGAVIRQLASLNRGYQLTGCDLNLSALRLTDPNVGSFLCYDICTRHPTLQSHFDAVLLMDVVEHIEDDFGFLNAALSHLRPGGTLIINVPANDWLFSKYDVVQGHKRRYTAEMVRDLFTRLGVQTRRIYPWGFLLVPLLAARKLWLRYVSNDKAVESGFVPPGETAHRILHLLKNIELTFTGRVPLGTSLLAVAQRTQS